MPQKFQVKIDIQLAFIHFTKNHLWMFNMLNTHLLYLNCLSIFAFNMTSLASRKNSALGESSSFYLDFTERHSCGNNQKQILQ